MRRKLLVGNWKMNRGPVDADALAASLRKILGEETYADIAVAPPFLSIPSVVARLKHSNVEVGAQNLHAEPSGAFTGEVSGEMLKSAGVTWAIVGHSERRQYFGENDAGVAAKVQAAFRAGLKPILCVGETLEERDGGKAEEVVIRQVLAVIAKMSAKTASQLTIAYEPVWAIGTGRNATAEQAQAMHATIRAVLAERFPSFVARTVRILYGGSMKGSNAKALLSQADVDGGLIGGASLSAEEFKSIVEAAR